LSIKLKRELLLRDGLLVKPNISQVVVVYPRVGRGQLRFRTPLL
jgi:hypothetical protein